MNLPQLPLSQAIKHYHAGNDLIVKEINTGKKWKFSNKPNSEISLDQVMKNDQNLYFFLSVQKDFEEFQKTSLKKSLGYTIGILPLLIAVGFFVAYTAKISLRFAPENHNVTLGMALILSYIGCHFLMKLASQFKEDLKEFRKRYYIP